jgi:SAM-dependent methyltransferase
MSIQPELPTPDHLPPDPSDPQAPRFDWRGRYAEDHTPWDLGGPHPELVEWLAGPGAGLERERVLVPGCGKGHDALHLARAGSVVDALDIVDLVGAHFAEELARHGGSFHVDNVLSLDPGADGAWGGPWDLVYEHTIFCAIDLDQRADFGRAMARCVRPGGHLLSFLFPVDKPRSAGGPPFGATPADLLAVLGPDFELVEDVEVQPGTLERNWKERRVLCRRL